eukprot:2443604-Rhodomonas_salina.1
MVVLVLAELALIFLVVVYPHVSTSPYPHIGTKLARRQAVARGEINCKSSSLYDKGSRRPLIPVGGELTDLAHGDETQCACVIDVEFKLRVREPPILYHITPRLSTTLRLTLVPPSEGSGTTIRLGLVPRSVAQYAGRGIRSRRPRYSTEEPSTAC